jgi:hypothetical protein
MSTLQNTTRPTSLAQAGEVMARMFTEEDLKSGLKIELQPTDVVISPFSKSGTTWLQQIVHTLRTRGDMDFDDISRVVPWIETSNGLGIDLQAPQKASPRAFKSHLGWDAVPKGGRYIVAIRNPSDVLVSLYRFMEGWFFEPGAVDIDEFTKVRFVENREYWKHLASWWPQRNEPNVLLLSYEHMKADLTSTIRRVASFADIELDPELLEITKEHASLAFMLEHKDRFDDLLMRRLSEDRGGLPRGSDSAKVREGKVGGGANLSPAIREQLDEIWREEITATLGYTDYDALIADL